MEKERARARLFSGLLHQLLGLPAYLLRYALGKWNAKNASQAMLRQAEPMVLAPGAVSKLKAALLKQLSDGTGAIGYAHSPLSAYDRKVLIDSILSETAARNRNNLTRTEAYRDIYFRYPELHWALLAHLISRNGGWSMTDLQGEWLPRMFHDKDREQTFSFLERANALIFQDAYPQLLLYERSLRAGKSLFHLLPAFGVSAFMLPVWNQFWRERDSTLLTTALIVNEQHYIEERVVQHPYYVEHVLHSPYFQWQPLLQIGSVMFPYWNSNCASDESGLRLAGLIWENFADIKERIEFGKRMYAMLFGVPHVYEGARYFAAAVKHTGSRADYAPQLFARARYVPSASEQLYTKRLHDGRLRSGAAPVCSPELGSAWKDRPVEPAESGDWFRSVDEIWPYFQKLPLPQLFEMTNEYGFMLDKIELAVIAMQGMRRD